MRQRRGAGAAEADGKGAAPRLGGAWRRFGWRYAAAAAVAVAAVAVALWAGTRGHIDDTRAHAAQLEDVGDCAPGDAAEGARPCRVRGRWSRSFLASWTAAQLADVRVQSVYASNSTYITYCDADLPGTCGHAVVEEAGAWDVASGRCPGPDRHCSFSGALSGFPRRQKQSLRPFMARFRLPGGAMVDPAIWLGSNATTTAHYDAVHNYYLQLHGTKTFFLVAPDAWPRLYLAPFGTVHQRQSRLPPSLLDPLLRTGRCPPASDGARYPALLGGACGVPCTGPDGCQPPLHVHRAVLRPGDALYLPVRAHMRTCPSLRPPHARCGDHGAIRCPRPSSLLCSPPPLSGSPSGSTMWWPAAHRSAPPSGQRQQRAPWASASPQRPTAHGTLRLTRTPRSSLEEVPLPLEQHWPFRRQVDTAACLARAVGRRCFGDAAPWLRRALQSFAAREAPDDTQTPSHPYGPPCASVEAAVDPAAAQVAAILERASPVPVRELYTARWLHSLAFTLLNLAHAASKGAGTAPGEQCHAFAEATRRAGSAPDGPRDVVAVERAVSAFTAVCWRGC